MLNGSDPYDLRRFTQAIHHQKIRSLCPPLVLAYELEKNLYKIREVQIQGKFLRLKCQNKIGSTQTNAPSRFHVFQCKLNISTFSSKQKLAKHLTPSQQNSKALQKKSSKILFLQKKNMTPVFGCDSPFKTLNSH